MYSVENTATGFGSPLEKAQLFRYKQVLIALWYTLFHTYVTVLFEFSRTMAVNLFICGSPVVTSKKHLQAPKLSSSSNGVRSSSCGRTSLHTSEDNFSTSRTSAVCSGLTFPKLSYPLDVCVKSALKESYDVADGAISRKSVICLSEKTHCEIRNMEEDVILAVTSQQLIRKECQKSEAIFSDHATCVVDAVRCDNSVKNVDNSCAIPPMPPHELVKLMNNSDKILLLDCRSFMAFNGNHIIGALNVGCSDRITRKRLLDGKI